jgi:hypothetical protein
MSGPIAKAANEVDVEREMGLNCISCSGSASTFMLVIDYFAFVFEMFGGRDDFCHRIEIDGHELGLSNGQLISCPVDRVQIHCFSGED